MREITMGEVRFGCKDTELGINPMIEIDMPGGQTVEFSANVVVDTAEEAQRFMRAVYLIMTSEQHNLRYAEDGEVL